MRKAIFPVHRDLKFAGLLNPLDTPHHMRIDEWAQFREAIILPKQKKNPEACFANAGLRQVSLLLIIFFIVAFKY